ncbi:MAG TPA: hypothetical protein VMS22_09150 [Candidatus Eisenbacteria bacterium]|nr:hypothetical protein [Candidatus Eisenbacteria bacterium]
MRLLTLVVIALLAVPARPVEAAFCKSRSGAVFVRDRCKRKETSIDLAASAGAPKGDVGAQGRSQPRLRAVDSGGRRLPGTFDVAGRFVYRDGDHVFGIVVHSDGFSGGGFGYNGMGCTEDRFVAASEELYTSVPVELGIAYYAGEPIAMRTFMSSAYPSTPAACTGVGKTYVPATGFCCSDGPSSVRSGPATPVDLSGFTPPFRVEVEE